MKKLALSLVALMFATSVFAMNFSVGAKGNIGIATTIQSVNDEPVEDILPVFSGSIGGVFGIQFTEMFALEPEVMFHFGNGFSMENEMYGKTVKYSYNWTTLEIPVMFKAKFAVGDGHFAVAVGPQFNFLLGDINGKREYDGDTVTDSISADDYGFNTFALGIGAGVEYGLPVGPGDLVFGVRWQMDLTNVRDDSDSQVRNMAVLPSVAYMIKL
jgi:hypothetical protein